MKLFVTGFGPFAAAEDNASEHLARECGLPHQVFEVSYQDFDDRFLALINNPPDAMLLMGVDVNAKKMRLETVAHNRIGEKPDVRGEVWGPGPIDPRQPAQLSATLWTAKALETTDLREPGYDAGGYLCNFSFFRSCQRLPSARVGFIHVPPFSAIPKEVQLQELQQILRDCGIEPSQ